MKKRLISLILSITIVGSVFASSFTVTAVGGWLDTAKTFGMNKVLDLGYRTIGKATNMALNATGDEDVQKVASIINTVLMGSTGKKLAEITSLCNEILDEVQSMHEDMEESFFVVEKMLGEQAANTARNKQDEKWNSDVMNVINEYESEPALQEYSEYMKAAVDYSNDKTNTEYKEKYEQEKKKMIDSFRLMYPGDISMDIAGDTDKLQDLLFTSTKINDSFINMINKLSANFVKGQNSSNITLAETAAIAANEYFPFSHQQYQYVHTVVGEQLMELTMCMLTASEFFDLQGEYILNKYGADSSYYVGYTNVINQYYNMITGNKNSVENRINEMLDAKMVIDKYTSKSLKDYMSTEDAVSVNMKIEGFESAHQFWIDTGTSGSKYKSVDKKYIDENVKFNRVMVNDTIYYIIDKDQFSDKMTLSASALEYKYDIPRTGDLHLPSTDYLNLIKNISDGSNNFKVSDKQTDVYDDLIATNSFALAGNVPEKYLKGYLPDDATGDLMLITSEYTCDCEVSPFHTKYATYQVIDAKSSHSTGTLKTKETTAQQLQPPGGDNQRFSAILTQQSDTYQQNVSLEANGSGIKSAQLVTTDDAENEITINPNETKKVESGKNLAINIKLDDAFTVSSIKCVRDNDLFSSSGTSESYIIGSADEFSTLNPNEDGSYTINYSAPYSDAKIIIETEEKHCIYDENGFCINCGGYQPATLNDNGVYEISNAGQLYWFASLVNGDSTYADFDSQNTSANAVLVKDIVVNDGDINKLTDAQSDSLRKWNPIGNYDNSFTGKFDGGHHTISGIYINNPNADNVGLFGYTRGGADIYNVGILNSYIYSKNCVGGILGRNNNTGVTVQKCFSEATVIGNEYVGGIVGSTYGGKILNCYNAGSVKGSKYVASIRGRNTYGGTDSGAINNCFNVGEVSGTESSNVGGIRGNGNGTINNCYCISNQLTDTAATTKTSDQFASGEVAYLLNKSVTDGSQIWYQNIDSGGIIDVYPKFYGGTVYYLEYKNTYSNTYSEAPKEPDKFDKDDDGNLLIKSYDDLIYLSYLVRNEYDVYGSQNYILTNNIKVEYNCLWTDGIGSIAENKPFNGTFDGRGYCIMGLNVKSQDNGGLFEIIGENGCVKNLFVLDCDFRVSSNKAGGIATINNGTIDHCVSGINSFLTGTVNLPNITIDSSELNSIIKGDVCGGIAGENNGTIIGCRNASVLYGTQCGGIAAVNTGKIYGCANNGKIGDSDTTVSGGLAAKNGGIIESSYNSGKVNAKSDNATGSVAGINGCDEYKPSVSNVFYLNEKGLKAVGSDSTITPDESNIGIPNNADFKDSSFVDKLNSVTDDSVTWLQNNLLNKGYPTIKCNFLNLKVKSAGNNITVKGNMHRDLNIKYDVCKESDSVYKFLSSSCGDKKILKAYSLTLSDKDGNFIPAELWCQGKFEISVPVESKNVQLAGISSDGNVIYCKPNSIENGNAVFTVSAPMSFAIVDLNKINNSDSNIDNSNILNDNTPIQTGSMMLNTAILIAFCSLASILIFRRRNKIG
ncbi:hypothetical protein [Ruminococcus bromii]|uniref:hypothetical protein n=1 Tax=Ruminococcus bromii TaxID=40518 RepID=UPI0026EE19D3|nr:hypothetical protein [Ruminococcus bromii]